MAVGSCSLGKWESVGGNTEQKTKRSRPPSQLAPFCNWGESLSCQCSRRNEYHWCPIHMYTHLFYFYAIIGVQHAHAAWIRPAEQDPISRLWSERTSVPNETAITRSFTAFGMHNQATLGGMAKYGGAVLVPRCPLQSGSSPLCVSTGDPRGP